LHQLGNCRNRQLARSARAAPIVKQPLASSYSHQICSTFVSLATRGRDSGSSIIGVFGIHEYLSVRPSVIFALSPRLVSLPVPCQCRAARFDGPDMIDTDSVPVSTHRSPAQTVTWLRASVDFTDAS
jgi:hypothetical protein